MTPKRPAPERRSASWGTRWTGYGINGNLLLWTSSSKQQALWGSIDVFGGIETKDLAKARQRSLPGPGAVACLRERPVDPAQMIPASELVPMGRRFQGVEESLPARYLCCKATDVITHHGCTCHRAGAQINQHQPLVHALSHAFRWLSIRHQVESGAPFNADRNVRMDVVIDQ